MRKILIIGSGGREHALGWKLSQSKKVSEIFYAPGNAGTFFENKGKNVSIDCSEEENFPKIYRFIKRKNIDLTIIGSEIPLANGIVDYLNSENIHDVFGPTKEATKLESDKFFSYDLMNELKIPQANSIKCYCWGDAVNAINKFSGKEGLVIKARGLASGKGVKVCDSRDESLEEITKNNEKYGKEVLITERIYGEEFSVFGISDGEKVIPLEIVVQDYKRVFENDKGLNTGGMGAYCPVKDVSKEIIKNISEEIMNPIVHKMKEIGKEYRGFIYAGMMKTKEGLKVIEFNARFGDPECQPAMMMIKSDLYDLISSSLHQKKEKPEFYSGASCCVVLTSKGYPGKYKQDLKISGLEEAVKIKNVKIFHAGTKIKNDSIVTSGGRVLGVTGYSEKGIKEARKLAYEAVSKISIPEGFHYRKDIAFLKN